MYFYVLSRTTDVKKERRFLKLRKKIPNFVIRILNRDRRITMRYHYFFSAAELIGKRFLWGCNFGIANLFEVNFKLSISIRKLGDDVFEVTVAAISTTVHTVIVSDHSLYDLTDKNVTKTQLLEFSFNFLLDREPNTSILSAFDIDVISKYFSDYRDEVTRWCDED